MRGSSVEWAIDAVGHPSTMESAIDVLGTGGSLIALGLSQSTSTAALGINRLVQSELHIMGSLYGSSNPSIQIPLILDLYRSGRLDLDSLVGDTYDLWSINAAFNAIQHSALGRSVVRP